MTYEMLKKTLFFGMLLTLGFFLVAMANGVYVNAVSKGVARAAVCDMVKPHFRQEDVCFGHDFKGERTAKHE